MDKQKFFWVAILEDDSTFMEFNPDGTENMYRDIPREKVKLFGLQSSQSSYFINLTDGKFHIKDYRSDKGLDVTIPWAGKLVPLTGRLPNFNKYNFFQLKSGYQDITRRPGEKHFTATENLITEHKIGWKRQMVIKKFGLVDIETALHIDPRLAIVKPVLKVLITTPGAKFPVPIAGSPYVMNL